MCKCNKQCCKKKFSDYAERAEPAEPTLRKNLFTNPDFEAI